MSEQNLLTTKQVAEQLSLSESALVKWRHYGEGPRFVKLGRAARYSQNDINAWVQAQTVQSTSEVTLS